VKLAETGTELKLPHTTSFRESIIHLLHNLFWSH